MSRKPFLFTLFFIAPPVVAWSQTAENPQKPSSYVVKKGDCLWNISKRVWGDPQKWPLLFAANEGKIRNPNLIYAGQEFTIPTTLTAEELSKATRLAESRMPSSSVAVASPEGTALKTPKKPAVSTASHESAAAPAPSNSSANPVLPSSEPAKVNSSNETAVPAESSSGSSGIVALILAILALGGGLFFWLRKRNADISQQPRPLSSYPQAGEPPMSKPVASPSALTPSPVTPSQPPVASAPAPATPTTTPAQQAPPLPQPTANPQSTDRMGGFTGTTANISMSQPPVPSKAEPSSSPSSSMPSSTPTPSTPPAQKPPENTPDTPSNPPSGNP